MFGSVGAGITFSRVSVWSIYSPGSPDEIFAITVWLGLGDPDGDPTGSRREALDGGGDAEGGPG